MVAVADATSESLLHATAAATRRYGVISNAVVYPLPLTMVEDPSVDTDEETGVVPTRWRTARRR